MRRRLLPHDTQAVCARYAVMIKAVITLDWLAMRQLIISASLLLALLATGCANALKTMVAHVNIDNKAVHSIATANAGVNVCLAENSINRERAFEFSTIAAQFLDLVVFDESYYKQVYEQQLTATSGCSSLDSELPKMTAFLRENYNEIAARLGRMRAEENRQIMQSLNNFRAGAAYSYPQAAFPPLQYRQEQAATQNYLVNTRRGLVQCRVTNNSYVFCL